MITRKAVSKSKKISDVKIASKNSKRETVSDVVVEKKTSENPETGVSVFTKTTNPKIVIQSENLEDTRVCQNQNICSCRFLKFVCLMIMCIIVLMTFFLTLRTYNIVNELSALLN